MRGSRNSFLWKLLNGQVADAGEMFVWASLLILAIVILIWAVVRIRTRFRDDDDPAAVDRSMLLGLGELHRQGDLSEAEFRSIKSQLIQRLDDSASAGSKKSS